MYHQVISQQLKKKNNYFKNKLYDETLTTEDSKALKDLDIEPSDVEEEMKKWLWRYKDGGQFAKA